MEQVDDDARWIRREALANARHRASLVGFRPAKLTGVHPSELRARALRPPLTLTPAELLLLAAIGAGAFLFGRWWGRKQKTKTVVGGDDNNLKSQFLGLDLLGAK